MWHFFWLNTTFYGCYCSNFFSCSSFKYEQENTKIEQQIEAAVISYQQHEKDVFTDVKPDSYIQLVSIYPELKSDTLVKEQIKTYQSNNKKIKELKVTAINGNVKRWWLYFGHKDVKY